MMSRGQWSHGQLHTSTVLMTNGVGDEEIGYPQTTVQCRQYYKLRGTSNSLHGP
jgi:hypothetical protein